jgi:RimJ/RimL family protein N-acetyltransferase
MSDVVYRSGKKVLLRPIERGDAPTLRRWMNDPAITQYLTRFLPVMEKSEEQWIDALADSTARISLGIMRRDTKALIGTIGLHEIDWRHRTAVTGTVIGEADSHGKGFGTDAKMLLLDLAFNAMDLYAMLSYVMATNERSLAYGKRCGYTEVGRIPKWIRAQNGERCDEVILIVTQESWRPLWQKYQKSSVS